MHLTTVVVMSRHWPLNQPPVKRPVLHQPKCYLSLSTCTQAICFDVDSTVIAEEGIDVLADFCGAAEAVADLTSRLVRPCALGCFLDCSM